MASETDYVYRQTFECVTQISQDTAPWSHTLVTALESRGYWIWKYQTRVGFTGVLLFHLQNQGILELCSLESCFSTEHLENRCKYWILCFDQNTWKTVVNTGFHALTKHLENSYRYWISCFDQNTWKTAVNTGFHALTKHLENSCRYWISSCDQNTWKTAVNTGFHALIRTPGKQL